MADKLRHTENAGRFCRAGSVSGAVGINGRRMDQRIDRKEKGKKKRLDVLLVEGGYAPSREKAKAVIMAGSVFINGEREDKAGAVFDPEKIRTLVVKGAAIPYVSRGGLKLEKALQVFPLSVSGKICVDIGASTGGFTDCMLINGAKKVYAVDVGHGQLDWRLRNDERVICMERTNFRYVTREMIPEKIEFASCDVSFISLTKILLPARNILRDAGEMVCLIKPQFEAGREKVGKKGVVRERAVHREVICKVMDYAADIGFRIAGLSFSPIRGPEGNIEYLLYLQKDAERAEALSDLTEAEAEKRLIFLQKERAGISETDDRKRLTEDVVENAHAAFAQGRDEDTHE